MNKLQVKNNSNEIEQREDVVEAHLFKEAVCDTSDGDTVIVGSTGYY